MGGRRPVASRFDGDADARSMRSLRTRGRERGCCAASVDLALINGTVITVDGRNTVAQAIAIGGGLVVAVGTSAEIRALAGADARVIDLAGKSVMPTLISTHGHPGFQKGTHTSRRTSRATP